MTGPFGMAFAVSRPSTATFEAVSPGESSMSVKIKVYSDYV
jgi:hypothetical protein